MHHKEQKESPSLIPLIYAKEAAFSKMLEEARVQAAAIRSDAETEAKRMVENAEKSAVQEAETETARAEKEIEEETRSILKRGEDEAKKLKAALAEKIPEAAKTVTELILPNGKPAA